jgi:nitrate/nitrite transport system substrate-binding protein
VIEAARWCDDPANKVEMCDIIGRRAWLNVAPADILGRMRGEVDYGDGRRTTNLDLTMKFWRDHASYPFRSHDLWFLTENIRWGILPENLDTAPLIAQVNREDIWRAAAARAGVPNSETPSGTSRGRETFFDGKVFDPENPRAYLDSLAIKRLSAA